MTNHASPFAKNRTKIKRVVGPLSLAFAMLALSGCEGSVTISPSGSATSSASESVASSPAPSVSATPAGDVAGAVINGLPTKKELAKDANGSFIQTTISADDPAMKYDASVVDPNVTEAYTEEEVLAAQQFIVKFIAEEGLDSTLNGTKTNIEIVDAWWAANKDKIDPTEEGFYEKLVANDNVYMPVYRYTGKKSELISGDNVTHVNSRKIKISAIKAGFLEGKQRLGFNVKTETVYNILMDGKKTVNSSNGDFIFTLTKDESGKWLISGYQNTFSDSPA